MLRIMLVYLVTLFGVLCRGKAEDILCTNIVPGLERLGQGVDLAKLDMFHDYTVDDVDGFVNTLVEYHCNEKKTWLSPHDKVTYQIPDEINAVVSLPSGVVISEATTQTETHQVKKEMAVEVGAGASLASYGMFSSSFRYKKSQETLTKTSRFVSQCKAFVSINQVDFIPPNFLTNSLTKYVRDFIDKQLPDKFEDNPDKYMEFFKTYGTHYFERGNFGGSLTIWFELENYLKKVMSDRQINFNIEMSFKEILKAHGAYNEDITKLDEKFVENSQKKERYFGGTVNMFEKEGYKVWWPTVARNPWLHSGQLRPITDLVTGPKKAQLARALLGYLDHHYLDEIQRTLDTFIGKHYEGEDVVLNFDNQIRQQMKLAIPNHSMLHPLHEKIIAYVTTPSWFKFNTSLCADWEGHHCAPIQMDTPLFFPCHTYYKCSTGSLSLSSPMAPDWFSQVTFTVTQTHCDHPIFWLQCYYNFKINVPTSLPGWLRNVQFCAVDRPKCQLALDSEPLGTDPDVQYVRDLMLRHTLMFHFLPVELGNDVTNCISRFQPFS